MQDAGFAITAKIIELWNDERDPNVLLGGLDDRARAMMCRLIRVLVVEEGVCVCVRAYVRTCVCVCVCVPPDPRARCRGRILATRPVSHLVTHCVWIIQPGGGMAELHASMYFGLDGEDVFSEAVSVALETEARLVAHLAQVCVLWRFWSILGTNIQTCIFHWNSYAA